MANENEYPKVDGDIKYGSEENHQSGNFITVEAGENISAGQACFIYLKDATNEGKAYKSDANVHALNRVTGISTETVLSGADVTLQTRGVYYEAAAFTDKETYYLSTTAGALSTTISSVRIGIANGTGQLMMDINQDDKDVLGTVKAWHKSMTGMPAAVSGTLSAFWIECDGTALTGGNADPESPFDGQTLPDLNSTQRFLRGNTTSGTTGGSDTLPNHTHSVTQNRDVGNTGAGGVINAVSVTGNPSSNPSILPAYMEMVWIMKYK